MTQTGDRSDKDPGAALRDARLAAGLSVERVADDLNLLVYHVEALEKNDYSRFNADLFVRGHVRSYARYLDLAPAPLLWAADERLREAREKAESAAPRRAAGSAHWRPVAALIGAVLIWTLAVLALQRNEAGTFQVESLPGLVDPLPLEAVSALGVELLEHAGGSRARDAAAGAVDRHRASLSLGFSENVWVQVLNADGDVLLAGVQKKGERVELTAIAPFEIVLAYWPAVVVKFNGHIVPVKQVASGNATRLRVAESS